MKVTFLILAMICISQSYALAGVSFPTNLSDNDQRLVSQVYGYGTLYHPVDNPYPLGGYSGLEVAFSIESLSTGDIGALGSGTTTQQTALYPRLSIGKGISDDFDLFFSFTPYLQGNAMGNYAGAVRWGFYQATFVPANFSLLVTGAASNMNNLVFTQMMSADVISGFNAEPFSFYVGAGTAYVQGQFDASLTAQGVQTNVITKSFHTLLGVSLAIRSAFAAFEIDNYSSTSLALKLGARL